MGLVVLKLQNQLGKVLVLIVNLATAQIIGYHNIQLVLLLLIERSDQADLAISP